MQKQLDRIAAITTHTLRFYRQQSSPAPVSIPEIFESALALFQIPLSASNIIVERQWLDNLPPVVCLEGEIRQVLANLISNAIDSMPSQGTLHLCCLSYGQRCQHRDLRHRFRNSSRSSEEDFGTVLYDQRAQRYGAGAHDQCRDHCPPWWYVEL